MASRERRSVGHASPCGLLSAVRADRLRPLQTASRMGNIALALAVQYLRRSRPVELHLTFTSPSIHRGKTRQIPAFVTMTCPLLRMQVCFLGSLHDCCIAKRLVARQFYWQGTSAAPRKEPRLRGLVRPSSFQRVSHVISLTGGKFIKPNRCTPVALFAQNYRGDLALTHSVKIQNPRPTLYKHLFPVSYIFEQDW